MTRIILILLALVFAAPRVRSSDAALAMADRQQFAQQDWWRFYYLSTEKIDPEYRLYFDEALNLVLPSMATKQPVLQHCLPVRIGPTLTRIDVATMGWDWHTWQSIVARHPYQASHNPLVIHAGWLLLELTDQHESDAYYRLTFGDPVPKTRDEALKRLGVDSAAHLQFGMIEGQSGVSVQGVRLIRNLSAARGYAWGTQDVLSLESDRDPLEQPEGDFTHDGEEWILGVRKIDLATGTQGALQVYFLANGQGWIVDRAPVDLVVDHTRFRGLTEIRVAGSCISCHVSGLNPLKRNEFRATIESGVRVLATYEDSQKLEAFHFANLEKEIARNNEDYAAIVQLACGAAPEAVASSYQSAVAAHDSALTLDDAAREVGCEPHELKLALGLASSYGQPLGARISSLASGGSVPRKAWEDAYLTVESIYQKWDSAQ